MASWLAMRLVRCGPLLVVGTRWALGVELLRQVLLPRRSKLSGVSSMALVPLVSRVSWVSSLALVPLRRRAPKLSLLPGRSPVYLLYRRPLRSGVPGSALRIGPHGSHRTVLLLWLRGLLEIVSCDQGSEDKLTKGLAYAVRGASIGGTMLLHDGHLVLLTTHAVDQLVHEHLFVSSVQNFSGPHK